jgi:Glycosyltransferases involved in cell wall biogenesis
MNQTQATQTTIIVPAYKEEEGLPIVLGGIFKILDDSYEVIVVDDGSTDGTSEVASQFPCRVIRQEVNRGKGEALKTGFRLARGENIISMDADDTYPA